MSEAARPPLVEHSPFLQRLSWLADRLAVAVAVALPWSVSASSIFIVAWLLAFLPTLNGAKLRASFSLPAGGLPVVLCLLALAAMTWSDGTQVDQFRSLQIFVRLLIIALLFVQFRNSDHGWWVIGGFIVSCTLLLAVSWLIWFVPQLSWRQQFPGVPVRDYIVQSGEFLICAFALGHLSLDAWRRGERRRAIAFGLLVVLFLANIGYVAAARSTFVALVALALLFVFQRFGWKQALAFVTGAAALIVLTWMSSPYLRARVLGVVQEIHDYQAKNAETSSGYRLQFWTRSIAIVAEAPIIGHGTGSQRELFRRSVAGKEGLGALITDNPHNQTLFVAIQLGGLGVVLLYAMWLAHLLLLRGDGLPAWVGTGLVAQNIVMGLFNASLVDFTFGWMYIFGVGTLGGMMLRSGPSVSAGRSG
jgi:O-antigen ligase